MFQNAAIDVAIALSLMYLMLSLFCTVINEYIATKLKLRSKALASTLEKLLDNETLRKTFYGHGLILGNNQAGKTGPQSTLGGIMTVGSAVMSVVRGTPEQPPASSSATAPPPPAADGKAATPAPVATPQEPPAKRDHPSYLSGRNVALALIGALAPNNHLPKIEDIQKIVIALPAGSLRGALLASLAEAGNDLDKLRTSIATWFDDSMERLSGAYKRQLKWISAVIGLLVAVAFNADTFNVATTLWTDSDRRAAVIEVAKRVASEPPPAGSSESAKGDAAKADAANVRNEIKKVESTLRLLPIGWNCGGVKPSASTGAVAEFIRYYWNCACTNAGTVRLRDILGWLFTAAALTLGAPFWFDTLQKFVNIRGAGAKPKREDEKATDGK